MTDRHAVFHVLQVLWTWYTEQEGTPCPWNLTPKSLGGIVSGLGARRMGSVKMGGHTASRGAYSLFAFYGGVEVRSVYEERPKHASLFIGRMRIMSLSCLFQVDMIRRLGSPVPSPLRRTL